MEKKQAPPDIQRQLSRKKSVQFVVEVFDERDTRCGIPLCPVKVFADLRFLLPLAFFLIFVQGIVSGNSDPHDFGEEVGVVATTVLFGFFGRKHNPRWLGVGASCTAVGAFLMGFKTSIDSNLWLLGGISQFFNGVALGLSVTLGSTYMDNNFPRYFPLILGAGASIKAAGGLIDAATVHYMTLGGIVGLLTIPIALLPKVIHRTKSKHGVTVNPTDDPSLLQDLRNSLSAVIKNDKVVYNSAATMFFFLGFNVICNMQFSIAAQACGFLLLGWLIQFIKPHGRILIGANIVLGIGFFAGCLYHSFTCHCDIISVAIFITFSFLSCFGRMGSFLFSIRSVDRNDKPVAIGITFALISFILIPKLLLTDPACSMCHDHSRYEVTYESNCSSSCCESNLAANLVGAGCTLISVLFDCIVWKHADSVNFYN